MADHTCNQGSSAQATEFPLVDQQLIDQLVDSVERESLLCRLGERCLPDRDQLDQLLAQLRTLVFPGFFGDRDLHPGDLRRYVSEVSHRVAQTLHGQIEGALRYAHEIGAELVTAATPGNDAQLAADLTKTFMATLPEMRRLLALDVQAAYDGDPAAEHTDETIFCYPGVTAIFTHRIAHELYQLKVPLLPRILQEIAHTQTGIDIHPGAKIGESFFIDHGGGVVVGETAVIGNHCRMYQGVTLGAKSFNMDENRRLIRNSERRHPTIRDRVTIYAGAIILGGDTVIGDDCVIAGSVFVTESVPPGHIVHFPKPQLQLRQNKDAMVEGGG